MSSEEVTFTPYERRALQLGFDEDLKGPEARAIRRLLDAFPWIVEVADCNFDNAIIEAYVLADAMEKQAKDARIAALKEYAQRMGRPAGDSSAQAVTAAFEELDKAAKKVSFAYRREFACSGPDVTQPPRNEVTSGPLVFLDTHGDAKPPEWKTNDLSNTDIWDGDSFIVAVYVKNSTNGTVRWSISEIYCSADGEVGGFFHSGTDEPFDWEWSDVSYYIKIN